MNEWRPTATLETLRARAEMFAAIRAFFAARGVMEVDTPALAAAAATDPHLDSFKALYTGPGAVRGRWLYLQTSPEFAMKRLLAAGSGPIYQLGKAYRNGEAGRWHNPEFTLLEWYRPGFDLSVLMDEVEALAGALLGDARAERVTYAALFEHHLGIDPHAADAATLRQCAARQGLDVSPAVREGGTDDYLTLLFTHLIEPRLAGRVFVHDYPVSQAMLARVRAGDPPVAERFELYIDGVELANGFHELADAAEQRRRFAANQLERDARRLDSVPCDERLLAALTSGLPECSGVALGVDRLLMLARREREIGAVIPFSIDLV